MAKTEIEIRRTVTITREESVTVTVDVPQDILDNPDDVFRLDDWVEAQLKITGSELLTATLGNWDQISEDEEIEIDEVINHDEG
jgi:hypothetical protein